MGSWRDMKTKYKLDYEDLPVQAGANIVVIEKIEQEDYDAPIPNTVPKRYETKTRTVLWFVGWSVPLRLNNTRIDAIQESYGDNPDDAIGKKIGLLVQKVSKFGEEVWDIVIHPHMPSPDTKVTPIPARLVTKDAKRLQLAMAQGVTLAALPAGPGGGGGGFKPAGRGLGMDAAVKLVALLHERNWTWDKLVKALADRGLSEWCVGLLPPDCDEALRVPAWAIISNLPKTINVDVEALRAELVARWAPAPVAPPDEIDPVTGEVIPSPAKPDKINPEDIPF